MYCRGMRAEAHADLSYPILGGEEAEPSWPAVAAGGRQWRRRPRLGQCAWSFLDSFVTRIRNNTYVLLF